MKNFIRILIKILIPLLVLAGASGIAFSLFRSRPTPPKQDRPERSYLVRAQTVARQTHRLDVRAQGTVEAARQLRLQPQVVGRVRSIDDALVPGGLVSRGDVLVRLDPTDYRLNVAEREASLEEARARLKVERGQQDIARQEWELFRETARPGSSAQQDSSLALREPQLQIAELAVEAAQTRLERARVDLRRAILRAPFHAIVESESVEPGQLVTSQSTVATLVGTDAFWVRASIPLDLLGRIQIPGLNAEPGQGSQVQITQDIGGEAIARPGRVIRLLGQLDQVGRMAQVLIEVRDPLGLKAPQGQRQPPLLLGSYVSVSLAGGSARELVEVSRRALREGDQVWVVGPDQTLQIRRVTIAARRPTSVLVSRGLEGGERVVLSQIGAPLEGMKLEIAEDNQQEVE